MSTVVVLLLQPIEKTKPKYVHHAVSHLLIMDGCIPEHATHGYSAKKNCRFGKTEVLGESQSPTFEFFFI
jgi:hypothetical protein